MSNKGRELTIQEIKNLQNFSKVYIEYLDEGEFDLEYCDTVHINTFYSIYPKFEDYDGNTFSLDEVIDYINEGKIKLYETDETKIKEIKPFTNYERIKNMTIEEMAKSRVRQNYETGNYENDIPLNEYYKLEDAIKEEIEWLNKEVE